MRKTYTTLTTYKSIEAVIYLLAYIPVTSSLDWLSKVCILNGCITYLPNACKTFIAMALMGWSPLANWVLTALSMN